MRHPHLFEIAAWPWLERLSARYSRTVTLADVPAVEWDTIAERGFSCLFLMGVWKRSPVGRERALADEGLRAEYDRALPGWTPADVPGSPYCILAYEPDPRMGGWEGLDAARGELNRRRIALVLDFVPNHTAFDHAWTFEHPDRYVCGTEDDLRKSPGDFARVGDAIIACARDPCFPPWRDVAQLNYFNPDTRLAMRAVLQSIARHCDGVRCDMAMLVLNDVFERTWRPILRERWAAPAAEFWPATIQGSPDLLFLAEVYWDLEWTLQQQGFHFTYDKRLLDRLRGSAAGDVRDHLRADAAFSGRLARFLENHDEERSAAALAPRLPAAAAIVATIPGMRFYFDGQIEGRKRRTPVQLGRWPEEPADGVVFEMYRRLLSITSAPLFHEGEWNLLATSTAGDGSFSDLIAFRWRAAGRLAIVAANLGSDRASAYIPLPGDLPDAEMCEFVDELTGVRYRRTAVSLAAPGLYVRLEAGGAHVFVHQGR